MFNVQAIMLWGIQLDMEWMEFQNLTIIETTLPGTTNMDPGVALTIAETVGEKLSDVQHIVTLVVVAQRIWLGVTLQTIEGHAGGEINHHTSPVRSQMIHSNQDRNQHRSVKTRLM